MTSLGAELLAVVNKLNIIAQKTEKWSKGSDLLHLPRLVSCAVDASHWEMRAAF